ncbi:snRNA-activating protein complex subunit [Anaeramoeba flamelloides]|uniref:snRNA-activating protein complex subunit n=1 Tax=Anaeramoeba flamelloides TaxID=1746091 RepID=A0AAV8A8U4_9EUKA|nr:snRNA-activating protein complex subunit [Anaeramoeba flamelloides]
MKPTSVKTKKYEHVIRGLKPTLTLLEDFLIIMSSKTKPPTEQVLKLYKQLKKKQKKQHNSWKPKDDRKLKKLVKSHGVKKWSKIAKKMKKFDQTQCMIRYRKITNCSSKKGAWNKIEDNLLLQYVKQLGDTSWPQVSKLVIGRSPKQCRERWRNQLNPNIKRGPFSEEEKELLKQKVTELGTRWSILSTFFDGRPDNMLKNYYYSFIYQKKKKEPSNEILKKNVTKDIIQICKGNGTANKNRHLKAMMEKKLDLIENKLKKTFKNKNQKALRKRTFEKMENSKNNDQGTDHKMKIFNNKTIQTTKTDDNNQIKNQKIVHEIFDEKNLNNNQEQEQKQEQELEQETIIKKEQEQTQDQYKQEQEQEQEKEQERLFEQELFLTLSEPEIPRSPPRNTFSEDFQIFVPNLEQESLALTSTDSLFEESEIFNLENEKIKFFNNNINNNNNNNNSNSTTKDNTPNGNNTSQQKYNNSSTFYGSQPWNNTIQFDNENTYTENDFWADFETFDSYELHQLSSENQIIDLLNYDNTDLI